MAEEEIRKGFRWVMGDGRSINVFTDPWLKNKQDFMVEAGDYNRGETTKVCQFLKANGKEWDVNLVKETFNEVDAQHILQIRIPKHSVSDRVAWMHTKEGIYSVKSGYQAWQERNTQSEPNTDSPGWRKI